MHRTKVLSLTPCAVSKSRTCADARRVAQRRPKGAELYAQSWHSCAGVHPLSLPGPLENAIHSGTAASSTSARRLN
jgi:hypothetical protein